MNSGVLRQVEDIRLGDWLMPDDGEVAGYIRDERSKVMTLRVRWRHGAYTTTTMPFTSELRIFPTMDQQAHALRQTFRVVH